MRPNIRLWMMLRVGWVLKFTLEAIEQVHE